MVSSPFPLEGSVAAGLFQCSVRSRAFRTANFTGLLGQAKKAEDNQGSVVAANA